MHQAAGNMEASLPFAAFQGEEHLSPAIQVTEPFGVFGIHEVAPDIFVDTHEPIQTFLLAGQLIALYHGDERLDVNPPEFLVPFQLLEGSSQSVHEVEDASILLVPTVFSLAKRNMNGLVDEILTT